MATNVRCRGRPPVVTSAYIGHGACLLQIDAHVTTARFDHADLAQKVLALHVGHARLLHRLREDPTLSPRLGMMRNGTSLPSDRALTLRGAVWMLAGLAQARLLGRAAAASGCAR